MDERERKSAQRPDSQRQGANPRKTSADSRKTGTEPRRTAADARRRTSQTGERRTTQGSTSSRRRTTDPRRAAGAQSSSTAKRSTSTGQRTRSSRARRRKKNIFLRVFLIILLLVIAAGGFLIWHRYGPSNEKADLEQYYGLSGADSLAVVINQEVIEDDEGLPVGKVIDGESYIEYSVVQDYINKRFYWDPNESVMLYTLPNGNVSVTVGSREYIDVTERKTADYVILKTEGRTAYIALPFIQQYTNMEYQVYEDPSRAVIESEWGEQSVATLKRNTQVRYQGGVKSPVLSEVKKSDKVVVLEDEDDWQKVCTADGFIGYVRTSALRRVTTETTSREFAEPEYTNISVNHTVNMAWHNVENVDANGYVLETIANTKGLTTIAPTWFTLADTEGNINSIADSSYVNYAHQSNLDVWGVVRDFHGGINSYDETYQVLSYTSKRDNLSNQIISAALQSGLDGINLDFELISTECGEHYIQFVRELSVKCRQNGLVFSIDNYMPQPYNEHYDLEEQGIVADYVVLMGYDEHTDGSYEAGSVASYGYVQAGIEEALTMVPNNKLITGIPLYTRLWFETPKTAEELAAEEGTEAANYPNNVTSYAMGMEEAQQTLNDVAVTAAWDENTRQNYAAWEADGGMYKIWLEDAASIEAKLQLIRENQLAGVAEWRLGWEDSSIWDLILQYVN